MVQHKCIALQYSTHPGLVKPRVVSILSHIFTEKVRKTRMYLSSTRPPSILSTVQSLHPSHSNKPRLPPLVTCRTIGPLLYRQEIAGMHPIYLKVILETKRLKWCSVIFPTLSQWNLSHKNSWKLSLHSTSWWIMQVSFEGGVRPIWDMIGILAIVSVILGYCLSETGILGYPRGIWDIGILATRKLGYWSFENGILVFWIWNIGRLKPGYLGCQPPSNTFQKDDTGLYPCSHAGNSKMYKFSITKK